MLEVVLGRNDERAAGVRQKKLSARMGDVSVFMREFKTRFNALVQCPQRVGGNFLGGAFSAVFWLSPPPRSAAARAVGCLYRSESGSRRDG